MPTKCNNHPLWAKRHRPPAPADETSSSRWTAKRDAESDFQNSRGRRVAASRLPAAQPRRRLIPGVGDASEARGERGDFVKTLQCSDCSPGAHFPPQCPTNDMFVCNTICFLFLFPPLSPTTPPLLLLLPLQEATLPKRPAVQRPKKCSVVFTSTVSRSPDTRGTLLRVGGAKYKQSQNHFLPRY